jgi:hypothetical protein
MAKKYEHIEVTETAHQALGTLFRWPAPEMNWWSLKAKKARPLQSRKNLKVRKCWHSPNTQHSDIVSREGAVQFALY